MDNMDREISYRPVSNEVPRAPFGTIQLRPDNRPKIPNSDLHRGCRRSLRLARDIVCRPAQDDRAGRESARDSYDHPHIRHSRPAAGEEHDVTDDTQSGTTDDEWSPSFRPLC